MNIKRKLVATGTVLLAGIALTAGSCESDATTIDRNLQTEADQFNIERRVLNVNTRSGEILFEVTGRCSVTRDSDLVVLCKDGPNEYSRHIVARSTDTTFVITQLGPVDADVYRTKVIWKPQSILPDVDVSVGEQ